MDKKPQSQKEAIEQNDLERAITTVREQRLLDNPIKGDYDFEHLSKIHHYLFDGLRDYAGKLRQIEPFYKKRRHSAIGYVSPFEFEKWYYDNLNLLGIAA